MTMNIETSIAHVCFCQLCSVIWVDTKIGQIITLNQFCFCQQKVTKHEGIKETRVCTKKRFSWLAMEFGSDKNSRKDIGEGRYSEKKVRSMNYRAS